MRCLKKIFISGLLFSIIGLKVFAVENSSVVLNKFNKNFQISFEKSDLKSCLSSLFVLLDVYKRQANTNEMFRTWTKIAIVYYFQDKEDAYNAALDSASNLKYSKNDEWYHLNRMLFFSNNNIGLAKNHFIKIENTNDAFIKKCVTVMGLYLGIKNFSGSKYIEDADRIFIEKINEFPLNENTWFGYGLMNFYLGEFYANMLMPEKSLPYLQKANNCFKNCRFYYKNWLYNYYYLLKVTSELWDVGLRRKYFLEFVKHYDNANISNDVLFLFYWIKGYYYVFENNIPEIINASVEAFKYAKNGTREKEIAIIRLVKTYFQVPDYKKAKEWMDKYSGRKNLDYLFYNAVCNYKLGYYVNAEKFVRMMKINYSNEPVQEVYRQLIKYYIHIDNFKELRKYIHKNIEFLIKEYGPKHFKLVDPYDMFAYSLWTVDGNIEKANQYYQKAIDILTGEVNERDIFTIPQIKHTKNNVTLARIFRNSAEAFFELSKTQKLKTDEIKYLDASLAYYELALEVITKHKASLFHEEQKLYFTNLIKHYYPNILQVCVELYEKTGKQAYLYKAFIYTEKSKSSVLLSMVRGADARKTGFIPLDLQKQEEVLSSEINLLNLLISEESNNDQPSRVKLNTYNTKLNYLYHQMDSLKNVYQNQYPAYYNLCFENEVIGADSLQKILNSNQLVIQYALSDKMLLGFLITKNEFKFFKETATGQLYSDIEKYRKIITGFKYSDTNDSAVGDFEDVSIRLYDKLLLPFEKYFNSNEIIILPDDVLNVVPFEAFITHKALRDKNFNYKTLNYMVKRHTISYANSASLLAQLYNAAQPKKTKPYLLSVAPVYDREGLHLPKIDSIEIQPLPGSELEVKKIRALLGGDMLLKGKATECRFKKNAPNYSILHLASHGFVNNEEPMYSKLLLMKGNDSIEDGFLSTYEIYSMKLNAALVVLSACNTGYGKLYKGEGVVSLARGFFMAGTQDVVMTLWSVTDKTSSRLMPGFYKYLSESETVGKALQISKIDYLAGSDEIMAHPYFWAGFVSMGNSGVCFSKPNKHSNKLMYIVPIVIIGLIYTGIALRKRKKCINR